MLLRYYARVNVSIYVDVYMYTKARLMLDSINTRIRISHVR